jgi:hypothetical protein
VAKAETRKPLISESSISAANVRFSLLNSDVETFLSFLVAKCHLFRLPSLERYWQVIFMYLFNHLHIRSSTSPLSYWHKNYRL